MKGTLWSPMYLRGVQLPNRAVLAPMSQYMATDGQPTLWHYTHYHQRALACGLVIVEATAVSPQSRITEHDLGLWDNRCMTGLGHIAAVISAAGAVPGLQISHGGRKSGRTRPWEGDRPAIGACPEGPSPIPFAEGYPKPHALSGTEIENTVADFVAVTKRAANAGFRVLELHAGHGRLLHSFYSPIANHRTDSYGGRWLNRVRLLVDTVDAVREVWPIESPLLVRLSCVDWVPGGWELNDSVRLARILKLHGVDLIDCTSGGIMRPITVPVAPGYQVPFSAEIRKKARIATAAVGAISTVSQAEEILARDQADLVLFGRAALLDPFLPLRASVPEHVPPPYQRGRTHLAMTNTLDHIPEL